jgi:hypothetical protein
MWVNTDEADCHSDFCDELPAFLFDGHELLAPGLRAGRLGQQLRELG